MVLQPKFVMLDEPTSALDMSVQAQIVDLLRDLQRKRDLAYLFISHDLKVVRALCNYVIVMRNGKVVEEGPAVEVFSNPKEDYTKALLAAAFNISVLHKNGARRLIARQAKEATMPEEQKPRLKLYYASPSRASVAMWMLEELGEPYEIELLSLKNGDQRKPAFLAINPMGKVPTLVDGGTIVSEVSAICCYLADAYPEGRLAPAIGDKLRGPYLKWLFFVPSCVEPAILDKAMNRPPPPRSTAGWADYDTVVEVLRDATGKASPYLLGERFSAADVVDRRKPSLGHAVQAACPSCRSSSPTPNVWRNAQRCSGKSPRTRHLHDRRAAERNSA